MKSLEGDLSELTKRVALLQLFHQEVEEVSK